MGNDGRLTLWNDCAIGHEAEYEAWYQGEHLIERLGVPGFMRGRRYQAIEAAPEYFTYYETTSPDVLTSPSYLERGNNPTPFTRKIMSGTFINLSRTICKCQFSTGGMRGAYAVTLRLSQTVDDFSLFGSMDHLTQTLGVARTEIWTSAEDRNLSPSHEESLRGGDEKISICLFVETLREKDAREIAATLTGISERHAMDLGIYQFLCELTHNEPA